MILIFFRVKFLEKLSDGLIDIHLIIYYFRILKQTKNQNPFVWKKLKFGRENIVQSCCTGLWVTVHLYRGSLLASW